MKITTNKKELKELRACSSGYRTFTEVHGSSTVTLSQCLDSNGWDDVWWLISETFEQFSDKQKTDLRLLGCTYALSTLDNFEKEFPEDTRPRLAIEAAVSFTKGLITKDELCEARSAAESAESAAWSAARSAARSAAESAESARSAESAAESAESAAWSAAESAAWSARSAAESAESAAWSAESAESAAWSAAESAESAAWSAAMEINTKLLRDLFLQWESITC